MSQIIKMKCKFCSKAIELELTDKEFEDLNVRDMHVQGALPNRDAFFRECFISGICYDCQSETFHRPKPGDTSWGEIIGDCDVCGASIYDIKDKAESGGHICHCCKSPYPFNGDEEEE